MWTKLLVVYVCLLGVTYSLRQGDSIIVFVTPTNSHTEYYRSGCESELVKRGLNVLERNNPALVRDFRIMTGRPYDGIQLPHYHFLMIISNEMIYCGIKKSHESTNFINFNFLKKKYPFLLRKHLDRIIKVQPQPTLSGVVALDPETFGDISMLKSQMRDIHFVYLGQLFTPTHILLFDEYDYYSYVRLVNLDTGMIFYSFVSNK